MSHKPSDWEGKGPIYKIKKKYYYWPTDPNFFGNVSGNLTLIFFGLTLLYNTDIGNFSCGFNFRLARDLPEIAKNRHSEKLTQLYIFIDSPWNSENRTQWKFNTPSKRHFRQYFPTRKIPDIRYSTST